MELLNKLNNRHGSYFISTIQSFYPLSISQIEKYKDKFEWSVLSQNESLKWSESLIDRYIDKWNWNHLTCNASLPWSLNFIEKYKEKWLWGLSYNEWGEPVLGGLSFNKSIPWSYPLLDKFIDLWDWDALSFKLPLNFSPSRDIIEKYKNQWNWQKLSDNDSIPWSDELYNK